MNILYSVILLSLVISASLLSLHSEFWYLPLIVSPVSLIGYFKKSPIALDAGIFVLIISYFLINGNVPFNILTLLKLIGLLFLFIIIWSFGRHLMLIDMIEENSIKGPDEGRVNRLRKDTSYQMLGNLLLGAVLSCLASMMGMYGSLETSGQIETILMVVFSFGLFLSMFIMLKILSSKED